MSVKVNFILGQLSEEEIESLKDGHSIIAKMILTPDDYHLFRYKEGEFIQVETNHGYRLWCAITHLEILENSERIIIIFTLVKASANGKGYTGA